MSQDKEEELRRRKIKTALILIAIAAVVYIATFIFKPR